MTLYPSFLSVRKQFPTSHLPAGASPPAFVTRDSSLRSRMTARDRGSPKSHRLLGGSRSVRTESHIPRLPCVFYQYPRSNISPSDFCSAKPTLAQGTPTRGASSEEGKIRVTSPNVGCRAASTIPHCLGSMLCCYNKAYSTPVEGKRERKIVEHRKRRCIHANPLKVFNFLGNP